MYFIGYFDEFILDIKEEKKNGDNTHVKYHLYVQTFFNPCLFLCVYKKENKKKREL
jgi:hypothetical protein